MSDTTGNKQRLLIVDDSKVIRVTARKILRDHFETVEAVDGNKAWEILNKEAPFSLIVSDLTMPGMDGFGLLEKIRGSHQPHISKIPVIIITGANDSEATMQRARDVGANDFIGKPFDAVHLLARTHAHADAYSNENTLTKETMELENQAMSDSLTGLANEAAFMDRGYQQLAYSTRHQSSLALFSIEVDDYGDLFTRHGNTVTEAVITSITNVLGACIRQEDMAARIGTARFTLLLPGMNNKGIRNLADRIIQDINSQVVKNGIESVRFTVSIGVAAPEIERNTRFDALLASANKRLQTAIAQGGNQVVHDDHVADDAPAVTTADMTAVPALPDDHVAELAVAAAGLPDVEDIVLDAECLPPDTTKDLPEVFAGSIPDLETMDLMEDSLDVQVSATGSGLSFSPEDYEQEENIVITAPGNYYTDGESGETPATSRTGPQAADNTADAMRVTDAETATVQTVLETNTESTENVVGHPGFFSRLWSLLTRKI